MNSSIVELALTTSIVAVDNALLAGSITTGGDWHRPFPRMLVLGAIVAVAGDVPR